MGIVEGGDGRSRGCAPQCRSEEEKSVVQKVMVGSLCFGVCSPNGCDRSLICGGDVGFILEESGRK